MTATADAPTNSVPRTPKTPPGPPRRAMFGLLIKLATDRLTLMNEAVTTFGDAVRVAIGPKVLYIFNHPDHAKHVLADNAANYEKGIGYVQAKRALGDGLLTSEGELWKKQRATIKPVFQAKRIANQADAVAEEAAKLVARLKNSRGPLDVTAEMTGLTLGVLGRTLLDADLDTYQGIGHSFEAMQDQAMFELVTLSMVPMWVPLPKQLRFRKARRDIEHVVGQLVAERDRRPTDGDDLLTRLIQSTRKEADPRVGRLRMRDELVTLLLAGHETTASTLSWTFHMADENPEVWERLRAEAIEVLGDRLPTYEDLRRLPYTSMVIKEVMRLYPPVWLLPRQARGPDDIGGWDVPAGSDVLISPYTLHRHPDYWDRPLTFDPDRFHPDRPNDRPQYAYIPFGAGPRFCVGNILGLMEATFVTAMVAREMTLRKVPGHVPVPEPMLSLRAGGGLPMTVHPVR